MTSDPISTFESTTSSELEIARTHVRQGNLAEAERIYRQVAVAQPDQIEALRFLANAALSRGDPGEAVALLSRAARVDRNDVWVLLELGIAYRSAQRIDEARSVFERALESSQGRNTTARLLLAHAYELDGRSDMALLQYFRAILDAQAHGQWMDDSTTEPGLRQLVKHAMRYVDVGRHALFGNTLEPFRRGINAARLGRVDTALAVYLRERAEPPQDPRQRPTFLLIPDLGAACFLDCTGFDWLADWSARVSSLDGEALTCIKETEQSSDLAPFSLNAMTATSGGDTSTAGEQWAPLYQRGIFQSAIRTQAPRLSDLLDAAPLVRIPNYAPDVGILALPPGIGTPARRGRTNAFCTIVICFDGGAPLQVTVGGEPRQLLAGQALAFDPSFGVEYAAIGDAPSRALILEVWNPGISALERDALTALTPAVVDFDSRLQELS